MTYYSGALLGTYFQVINVIHIVAINFCILQ